MKLKPLKIGQATIGIKMQLKVALALFILGAGIGISAASSSRSMIPMVLCTIMAIVIIVHAFFKTESDKPL